MDWPRAELGVVGDNGATNRFRLEVEVRPGPERDRLVCLHDEASVGTFARVFAGRVRQGGFSLPLALKIQRDAALSDEEARSVSAKFACERLAYNKLQSGRPVTARHHDFAPADSAYPTRLPPSIVCRHASHALEPACPRCGGGLTEPLLVPHDERRLACEKCGESYLRRDDTLRDILRASARQQPACSGCSQTDAACAASAQFLNFYSARLLAFERLDLDLADFLDERERADRRARHAGFWEAYKPDQSPLAELLGVFRAVVGGVRVLHEAGVTHFDLKPRNVCLRAADDRLDVRLIDLGFADVPEEEFGHLRQVQGDKRLESDHAAPELTPPGRDAFEAAVIPLAGGQAKAVLQPPPLGSASPFDPLVAPGDRVEVDLGGAAVWEGVVLAADASRERLTLTLRGDAPLGGAAAARGRLRVRRHAGQAADLFSLGVLLLEMLTAEANVKKVRDSLGGWLDAFLADKASHPPGRWTPGLVARLFARLPAASDTLGALFDRLGQRFGAARDVAEELFGVALRLVYRSGHQALATYCDGRAAPSAEALTRLEYDLSYLAGLLDDAAGRRKAEARAGKAADAGDLLRKALDFLPPLAERPEARPVAFDRPRLLHAVSMAAGGYREEALSRLVWEYGHDAARLRDHLRQLGEAAAPAALPLGDFSWRTLVELLRLNLSRKADPDSLAKLRAKVKGAQGRPEYLDWAARARPLVLAALELDVRRPLVSGLLARVKNLFLQRARELPNREVVFRLPPAMRSRLGEKEALEAVESMRSCLGRVHQYRAQLNERWKKMRVEWRQFPLGLRVMLDSMAGQVDEEMESVIKRFDRWAEGLGDALEKVGHYIERNVVGIASEWDEAAPDPRSGRAEVKLDCGGIARDYDESGVEAAAAVLAAGKLSQGVYTQAHLFLLEYKEIEAGGAGDD